MIFGDPFSFRLSFSFLSAEREDCEPTPSKPCMSISYTIAVVKGSRKFTTVLKGSVYSFSRVDLHYYKYRTFISLNSTIQNFFKI